MGIGEFVEKARETMGEHADEAGELLEKAADAIKEHTPDAIDTQIDSAVDKVQELLDKE